MEYLTLFIGGNRDGSYAAPSIDATLNTNNGGDAYSIEFLRSDHNVIFRYENGFAKLTRFSAVT